MDTTANLTSALLCAARDRRREVLAPAAANNAKSFLRGMHAAVEQVIAKNRLFMVPDGDACLVCLEGELWVTREGDIEDYILGPGQRLAVRRGDRAAVQALRPSRVRLGACQAQDGINGG
jgi:hypothetical protein